MTEEMKPTPEQERAEEAVEAAATEVAAIEETVAEESAEAASMEAAIEDVVVENTVVEDTVVEDVAEAAAEAVIEEDAVSEDVVEAVAAEATIEEGLAEDGAEAVAAAESIEEAMGDEDDEDDEIAAAEALIETDIDEEAADAALAEAVIAAAAAEFVESGADISVESLTRRVEGPSLYTPREIRGRARRVSNDARLADIHYKNIPLLTQFLDGRGRILSRRKTRVSAKMQRRAARSIKLARHLALLPYTGDHTRITRKHR